MIDIQLISAQTGNLIENILIKGNLPTTCPDEIVQSNYPQRQLGNLILKDELMDSLEIYVIP
jgi:hypothetical protein